MPEINRQQFIEETIDLAKQYGYRAHYAGRIHDSEEQIQNEAAALDKLVTHIATSLIRSEPEQHTDLLNHSISIWENEQGGVNPRTDTFLRKLILKLLELKS